VLALHCLAAMVDQDLQQGQRVPTMPPIDRQSAALGAHAEAAEVKTCSAHPRRKDLVFARMQENNGNRRVDGASTVVRRGN
jgi:hypothetical protein